MTDGVLKYGGRGNSTAIDASAGADNFIGAGLNGLSLCCTPIELLANDGSDQVLERQPVFSGEKAVSLT